MERVRPSFLLARTLAMPLLAGALLHNTACSRESRGAEAPRIEPPATAAAPVQGAAAGAATPADDGQWLMAAHDYANTRFSGLDQIDVGNVANLKLAWTFSTGVLRGHEGAPLVVGSTMYFVSPYPNRLFALDLTKPGAPLKWMFDPRPVPAAQGVACCDVVNRGAAYWDGKVIYNTLDDQVVAVDAATGKEAWRTRVGDINRGETMTMAPIVARGKVIVGVSGGEMGVRGWVKALDAGSGKVLWTAYHTGPDRDVLIGARFRPFYPSDRGRDLGVTTWPGEAWKIGGGGVWGWVSYDPALNLIYYGTANPGPWNPDQRPGDNKWTAGMFARDPDTGEAVWAYQWSPHDLHDYDGINELILLDLPIAGQVRKVLVRPERNGYVYVMDRQTGQVLSATPFQYVTSTKGIDLRTGRPIENPATSPKVGQVVRNICPASPGAKDWQPSAWSPRTRLLYIPSNHLCEDVEGVETGYIAGTPYVGMNVKMYAGPGGNRGELIAWDPVAARKVWGIEETFPTWSGVLATAGDVVFYGTMDGWLKAVDARTGRLLWQFRTGSGIIGQPIAYRGPDGKEYITVASGVGGWSGAIVAGDLDPRDGTGALGFVNAMADLPEHTAKGGTLYTFALP
ncbi:MAG TPA: methanol/ethanol family PQQ-dependent dehydrogenase [Longimicrobiales bacterium]|nr:methanol/ethanol family PQQ-dependent dehydrogenase [Longimicrobiales bacterium]